MALQLKLRMKKKLLCLAATALLTLLLGLPAYAVGPAAASESYVVADAATGQILYASDPDAAKNPASITKIMIMGLACEKAQGDWSVPLTVSHDAVYSLYRTDSSHIALQEGEVVTLADMLYAAELVSANDAANVLAEYVGGGTIAGGVEAMNAKAAELGLENTHFANPHGITDPDHYTTAADMAEILRWALGQPGFEQLFCENEMYTMPATNLQSEQRYFYQKDYIRIGSKSAYVPTVIGSKTGYTDAARYTYACLAEENGMRLICVVLHSQLRTEKFADVKLLLGEAFANFHPVTVPAGAQSARVPVLGGGPPLGELTFTTPEATVLLHNSLSEEQVTAALELPEEYLLGGEFSAWAVYTVDGAGVQENCRFRVPLAVEGVDELLEASAGAALPASGDVAPAKGAGRIWWALAALLAAAAAVLLALWRAGRLEKLLKTIKTGLPQLRNRQKPL